MEVILQKDFFAPNNIQYRSKGPKVSVEIPDEFKKFLPKSAKVVDKKMEAKEKPKEDPFAYRDEFDAEAKNVDLVIAQAEAQIAANAEVKKKTPLRNQPPKVSRKKLTA